MCHKQKKKDEKLLAIEFISENKYCIAFFFFKSNTFIYSVGDFETLVFMLIQLNWKCGKKLCGL